MTDFYTEKNVKFQLLDMDEYPETTIWKAWNLKEDVMDSSGNAISFPIKDGELMDVSGTIRQFDDLTKLPRSVFTTLYPKMQLTRTTTRRILVGEVDYWYRFKATANKKLNEAITTIKNSGGNPLSVVFQQIFDKSKQAAQMYALTVSQDKAVEPSKEIKESAPPPVSSAGPSLPAGVQMSDKEKEVFGAVNKIPENLTEEKFVKVFVANGIEEARAKELFPHYKQ